MPTSVTPAELLAALAGEGNIARATTYGVNGFSGLTIWRTPPIAIQSHLVAERRLWASRVIAHGPALALSPEVAAEISLGYGGMRASIWPRSRESGRDGCESWQMVRYRVESWR